DLSCAPERPRGDREAPCVRERIENLGPAHETGPALPILALVEEEARLVARRPDEETHLVLGDLRLDVAERSRVLIDVRRKPLPVGRDARHLEDDAHISEKLDEELAEELPATKEARGVELENDQARIAVDDEPAQPVPF